VGSGAVVGAGAVVTRDVAEGAKVVGNPARMLVARCPKGSGMSHLRLVARLDVKAPNLVKGVRLEGLRVVGSPSEHAARYAAEGADEIHYQDIVASLYGRSSIESLVSETASEVFIP
jgi:hypothetical protein